MPLEFSAEVFLRFLFEVIGYTVGYATGWLLIPTLTFGYYDVEPLSPPKRGFKRMRSTGVRHSRQVSAEATAAIGVLFWAIAVTLGVAFWWFSRPN